jgi:hypothetical protein
MSRSSAVTTDHDVIRNWAESRKGHPAVVRATHESSDREGKGHGKGHGKSAGILRIDFDPPQDSLERVGWDEFFDTFDDRELAFLFQETTAAGRKSRFSKFVQRASVAGEDGAGHSTRKADGDGAAHRSSGSAAGSKRKSKTAARK